jgi:hypothetical protein
MRDLESAEISAIQARTVVARDFLWVTALDRITGLPQSLGFWNDVRNIDASVKDGRTGAVQTRAFTGLGPGLSVGRVPLTSDITVRSCDIVLPHLDTAVAFLVRGLDARSAPIDIYRGYFDPSTRLLVAPAKPRFVGYVDGAPIVTPAEGQEGSITLRCVSTTRELTRTNAAVRSHESQIARFGGDFFYRDTGVVGEWEISWGTKRGPVAGKGASAHDAAHEFG